MRRIRVGFRSQLLLLVLGMVAIALGVSAWWDDRVAQHTESERAEASVREIGANLASNLVNPLYRLEVDRMRALLNAASAHPEVLAARVFDADASLLTDGTHGNAERGGPPVGDRGVVRQALASRAPALAVGAQELRLATPVLLADGTVLGAADLEFSLAGALARRAKLMRDSMIAGFVLLFLAFILADFLSRRYIRPLEILAGAARALGAGALDARAPAARNDEIGDLANEFNAMAGKLEAANATLLQAAHFDPVTGLPNRRLIEERLGQAIAQARRRSRGAGVLFLDLDRFKLVNDTFGHHVGDELLAMVGKRLRDCVRQDDTLGRMSGDEFAVVIADLSNVEDAAIVAQKIIDRLGAPFDLHGHQAFVSASIGVAAFPDDGDSAEMLLKNADMAMYRVKHASRNAFCFFTADMNARTASNLRLRTELHHAVDRGEFRLHYQPIVHLARGAVTGVEALLRWQHPERGLISPAEFIPALEDTGLIVAVGDWVIREASAQLSRWNLAGVEPVPIAVNLSARQFRRRDLDRVIVRLLEESGVSPDLLELEITESSLMEDYPDAARQLGALRAAGLRISLDDFGTGYSSLANLTRLPLSTLKIDRSFVSAVLRDPASAAIVKMTIDMARYLDLNVVAEGIESGEETTFLQAHGCEFGQGYYFGRPVSAEAISGMLRMRHPITGPLALVAPSHARS